MAAIDPVAYLRTISPFAELPPALFEEAARSVEVVFHPAGTTLVRTRAEPLHHLYVVRKGAVRLERDGRLLQVLEEGEVFGYTSLLKREATLDVVVDEDLVAYRLPDRAFQLLLQDARFAAHFAAGVGARLQASFAAAPMAGYRPDVDLEIRQIAPRQALWIEPGATVGEAARIMRRERASSLLVRGDPPGILTDRDLRTRVLAAGLGPTTPVRDVCTSPLRTVEATTRLYEAWARLLDADVHHLPLTRGGEIVGMVTSTDLLRHAAHGPIALLRGVERLVSRDELSGYAARVAEMTASLLANRLDALVIAGFVARLNDALVLRILRWAEEDLGPPPAPYAWLVLGSEGRMEQTLLTDQDNALVYADEGAAGRAWFQALADRANADLETAGFPACPGGYMARNWSGPISEWTERFAGWIDVPNPQALLGAAIFFDFRRAGGDLDLAPLEAVLRSSAQKTPFLRFFAAAAMEFHPPASFLLRLRGGSTTVDLKAHGLSPIVFLARCYALEAGSRARTTVERLEAAARAGLMDAEDCARVVEAFRFLLGLRLRRQLEALSRGGAVTSKFPLSELGALERTRLKDSFRAVASWHGAAKHHYQTGF